MKPLTIEIHGTGVNNRGAELMADAVAERLRSTFPGVQLVVPDTFGPFEARARYGFLTTWELSGGLRTKLVSRLAPKSIARLSGIIDPGEVNVVLDASGFAFSDQWGPGAAEHLVAKMDSPARRRQPLILLPQALGPCETPDVRRAVAALMKRAALVCARDSVSFQEMESLCPPEKLRQYPDFTVGLAAGATDALTLPEHFSAIIPNQRMVDKTASGEHYLSFLSVMIAELSRLELNPVFLLHDNHEDRKVITTMQGRGANIPVIEHPSPRVLKGILARATVVVGSRFHALVGALSQGIPTIGAGWSHKYPELFRDFASEEFLIADLTDAQDIHTVVEALSTEAQRRGRHQQIMQASSALKARCLSMWEEIEGLIAAAYQSRRE